MSKDAIIGTHLSPATAAKYDKDPIYEGFISHFPLAIAYVSKVSKYGADKHQRPLEDKSFLTVPEAYKIYSDAVGRHMTKEAIDGPLNPEDANMLHAGQLAWNAMARLEVWLRQQYVKLTTEK